MGFRCLAFSFAVGLSLVGLGGGAEAACYSAPEYRAARVRQLQTELMVAALSCARHPELALRTKYNEFVNRFGPHLADNATVLRGHFARHYGKRREREFDSYITSLANEASMRALAVDDYCRAVAPMFDRVLRLEEPQLEAFAADVTAGSRLAKACAG